MRISIGALSLLFLTVSAAAAHAHASLAHASPSVGSSMSAAPTRGGFLEPDGGRRERH
jgi:methionine-rich copper-binding protein CopC